jgi:hypothetical protein
MVSMLIAACLAAACSSNPTTSTTPTTPTPTSPVTEDFSSVLTVNGMTSHAFKASALGAYSVTLTSLGTSTPVGLGVGIPNSNGAGCNLNIAVSASAASAPQIAGMLDVGTYCVEVFDTGVLRGDAGFSVRIVRP